MNINDLTDIRDLKINQNLPVKERLSEFTEKVKNPYIFKYGDKIIKIKHSGAKATLDDRIKNYLDML